MMWTNLAPRIVEPSTPFEFVLQFGTGIRDLTAGGIAYNLGFRLHHISNAYIGDRNRGINSIFPNIGISMFLPDVF